MIARDEMALVFDYDPLMAQIEMVGQAQHYHTQERLMTLIVDICASYPQIEALEICLRKTPVFGASGTLGVHLALSAQALAEIRDRFA